MKKNIIIVILFGTLSGYLFGYLIYGNYKGSEYIESDGNIYYVQYGAYTSNEAALSNASNLNNYLILEEDDKYYVYLGITTSLNSALKIQNFYEEKDIYTYIRDDYVENSETLKILKEYDLKLESANDTELESVIKEIFDNQELNF